MRYVQNKLVLRVTDSKQRKSRWPHLRSNFREILTEGDFHVSGPLGEERTETELAGLARLSFRFNRRSLGRLRQLIDYLNQTTPTAEPATPKLN